MGSPRIGHLIEENTVNRGARFLLTLLVVNLHILRNLPGVGNLYLVAWAAVSAMVCVDYLVARKQGYARMSRNYLPAWLLLGLTGFLASVVTISLTGALYGLGRFWYAIPLYIALIAYVRDEGDLRKYIGWAVTFFAVAVATIPMQVATGPVSWFREESVRGEFERYSSLLGGLNAAGGIAGTYLLLAQSLTGTKKWLLTAVISVCVLIDLSKSGILTIGVALLLIAVLNIRKAGQLILGFSALAAVILVLYQYVLVIRLRIGTTLIGFGFDSAAGLRNSDSTVSESAWDRLTVLPMENIHQWMELESPLRYLIGGGFGMGSTALVPLNDSLAPMAHNQYAEILTVFGALGALVLAWALLSALMRLSRVDPESGISVGLRRLLLLGLLLLTCRFAFANGGLYHPASATPLFFCLYAAGARLKPAPQDILRWVTPRARQGAEN